MFHAITSTQDSIDFKAEKEALQKFKSKFLCKFLLKGKKRLAFHYYSNSK